MVILYWPFGTMYWTHLQGSRSSRRKQSRQENMQFIYGMCGWWLLPSKQDYHSMLHNTPEEHSSHQLRSRSLKSLTNCIVFKSLLIIGAYAMHRPCRTSTSQNICNERQTYQSSTSGLPALRLKMLPPFVYKSDTQTKVEWLNHNGAYTNKTINNVECD
jgi:hypothetical protein